MTTSLLAAGYFGGNGESARRYLPPHPCPQMLSKSGLACLHYPSVVRPVFACQDGYLKPIKLNQYRTLFPWRFVRGIPRCRLLEGEDDRGLNASKGEYFQGYQVALLINSQVLPVQCALIPGSYAEQSALAGLAFDLPQGSVVGQDSGFTDYE